MSGDAVSLESTDLTVENMKDGRIIATLRLDIGDGLQLIWTPNYPDEIECRVLDGRKARASIAMAHLELSTVSVFLDTMAIRVQQAREKLGK